LGDSAPGQRFCFKLRLLRFDIGTRAIEIAQIAGALCPATMIFCAPNAKPVTWRLAAVSACGITPQETTFPISSHGESSFLKAAYLPPCAMAFG